MRIAFISDEFPPDTPGGGIATYLVHAAAMLSSKGNDVEIFAPSQIRSGREKRDGYRINWVQARDPKEFRTQVVQAFGDRHNDYPFDVIEGTDYNASSLGVQLNFRAVPSVIKLHTPNFFVDELHANMPPLIKRLRMHIGALRQGRVYRPRDYRQNDAAKAEMRSILLADELASPSHAIANEIVNRVGADADRISIFPYCFAPSDQYLSIDANHNPEAIIFIGRLEVRKGVLDLAQAFVKIARRHPAATLTFVGREMPLPNQTIRTTKDEIETITRGYADRVKFLGQRDRSEIPVLLADAGIAVFPSHWESFGLVCCEAMAAARAVIGSRSGGMSEILDNGAVGHLTDPASPEALAAIIDLLLSSEEERIRLGKMARKRSVDWTSYNRIYPLQRASYERAILRAKGTSATVFQDGFST